MFLLSGQEYTLADKAQMCLPFTVITDDDTRAF
jgi:hypothetical protein